MALKKKNSMIDAIAMLRADHRKVEALFEAYEKGKGARKAAIAKEICQELSVHSTLEEELLPGAAGEDRGGGHAG
jgi:hemerythrin superfamily protein